MSNKIFPVRLRYLRERRQISRRVLSELCGLSKNMIAIYERGEIEPAASTVIQMADYFGVSADYLLGREKNFESAHYNGHGGENV